MASELSVKQYLALWLQVGKQVLSLRQEVCLAPKTIRQDRGYSPEFEQYWQKILENPGAYYLSGTDLTFAQLFTDHWDLQECSRCVLPVPVANGPSIECVGCPCNDIALWPNNDLPQPRLPIDGASILRARQHRLSITR